MNTTDIVATLARHRTCFQSGKTRPAEWREQQLAAVGAMVTERAGDFVKALWSDLRRNRVDATIADIRTVADEAAYARRQVRRWMKPQRERTPFVLWPGRTMTHFDPLGVGLIIGAWNYPIQLVLSPLIAALSGGNCAVLKPSEVSPASAEALARLVPQYLDREAVSVLTGGVEETTALLEQHWDHIFFTGGTSIGRIVMTAAAKTLTPVVLELGGKSPAIVHSSADLDVTARRIAHGRWLNAGQTCTAPDYALVSRDVMPAFLGRLKATLLDFYGADPQKSPDYGRIVSAHHFDRVKALLAGATVFHGGQHDRDDLYIAPTILTDVSANAPILHEEVFGPILPVLPVDSVEQAIRHVNERPHPLGLYVFAGDRSVADTIFANTASGDAALNDCAVQPIVRELPFGGVGNSGMGKYHGQWGFRAYTNARGVLYRGTRFDAALRYPPYSRNSRLRNWLMRVS
ncbi:MAG: aldehyde dehydrogenase family protein [Proteobacteria bacterium]|nr:aldehyde dehydrogenase family protein [Pseudomonadota bacterium]